MPNLRERFLQSFAGFKNGDGRQDSAVYLDGHVAYVDVVGDVAQGSLPAFVVRGLNNLTNAPTNLFTVFKDGTVSVSIAITGTFSGNPNGSAGGVLAGSYPVPIFAAGQPWPVGTAGGVLTGSFPNPVFANLAISTSAFAAGAVTGTAAANDILRYGEVTRRQAYVPAGWSASQINGLSNSLSAAGGGAIYFETSTYTLAQPMVLKTGIDYLGNGALLWPNGSIDTVQTDQFDTFMGTNATTFSGAPYGFSLQNFSVVGGSLGRNGIAVFGMGYTLQDLLVVGFGRGSAIREEYGTNQEDWVTGAPNNYLKGETASYHKNLTVVDGMPSGSMDYLPASSAMSMGVRTVTNVNNPAIQTVFPHLITAGMTVTVTGVGGAVGVNGAWTVASVIDPYQFQITTGSPGVFTSGGGIWYGVGAAYAFLGPHDSFFDHVVLYRAPNVQRGRRGMLLGSNDGGGQGGAQGSMLGNFHLYNNNDVGLDLVCGGILFDDTSQVEGAYKCNVLVRNNGRNILPARIYAGHGGVTQLSIRGCNQNVMKGMMHQGGSGEAPPTNFYNTYLETVGGNLNTNDFRIVMTHDNDTNVAITAGSLPNHSFVDIWLDAFALTGASTLNIGWAMSVNTQRAGLIMVPSSLTATFN